MGILSQDPVSRCPVPRRSKSLSLQTANRACLVPDDRKARNRPDRGRLRGRPGRRSRGGSAGDRAKTPPGVLSHGTGSAGPSGTDGRRMSVGGALPFTPVSPGSGASGSRRRAFVVRPTGRLRSSAGCWCSGSGNGSRNSTGLRGMTLGMSCTGKERPASRSDGSEWQASRGSVFNIAVSPAFPAGSPGIRSGSGALGEFRAGDRLPQSESHATGQERSDPESSPERNGLTVRLPAVRYHPWIPARSCCRPNCVPATVGQGAAPDRCCKSARHGGTGTVGAEVRARLQPFPIS